MARFELVIESGAGAGTKLPLPPEGTVTLGGGDDASLRLPGGPTMARYLVGLELQPDGVLAREVPGRGTIGINGKLVQQGTMRVGDRLRLGITVLRLGEAAGEGGTTSSGASVLAAPPVPKPLVPPPPGGAASLPRPRLPTPGSVSSLGPRPLVPVPSPAAAPISAPVATAPSPAPAAPVGPAPSTSAAAPIFGSSYVSSPLDEGVVAAPSEPTPSAPPTPPAPSKAAAPEVPPASASSSDDEELGIDFETGESEELEVEVSEEELQRHREAEAKAERERTEAAIRAQVRIPEQPSIIIDDELLASGAESGPHVQLPSIPAPAISFEEELESVDAGPVLETGLPSLDALSSQLEDDGDVEVETGDAITYEDDGDFDIPVEDPRGVPVPSTPPAPMVLPYQVARPDSPTTIGGELDSDDPVRVVSIEQLMPAIVAADITGRLEAVDIEEVDLDEAHAALESVPALESPAPIEPAPPATAVESAPAPAAPEGNDWSGYVHLTPEEAASRRDLPEGVPDALGDWELIRPIGQGNMATVYEAVHTQTRVRAALKVLQPEPPPPPVIIERFVREQRINQTLVHPRIARCFAVGAARSWLYIASEFVAGGDASELISPYSNVGLILRLGADLFSALACGHAHGVIHRDVKPANLLLTEPDVIGLPHGKLTDFGLAKAFSSSERPITRVGEAGGSLLMMAPEQLLNFSQAGPSADLYSAGATIYRLLTADTHLVLPVEYTEATYAQVGQAITEVARVPLMARRGDAPPAICLLVDMLVACDPVQRRSMSADGVAQQFAYWADMYGCGPVEG